MIKADIRESAKDGKWYVRLSTANNEAWFTSEGYDTDTNAVRSVRDFMAALGQKGTIEDGVIHFEVETRIHRLAQDRQSSIPGRPLTDLSTYAARLAEQG